MQASLLHLLERKFGPLPDEVRAVVAQAGSDRLAVWTDKLLFANSVAEVFSG